MLKQIFSLLVTVGAWLAIPVALVCLYDKFFQESKRPVDDAGEPAPGPQYVRIAYNLLPFVIIAAVVKVGVETVIGWAQPLIVPLSYLAVPIALLAAYDRWVLAPQRPRTRAGDPVRGPWYVRIAYGLLPFAILAVAYRIGMPVVFGWLKEVAVPLSYVAVPVGLWCLIDSWWLAPRRQIAAGTVEAPDPPLTKIAYVILPALIVAVIVRMITAETLDFSLVLFLLSLGTGAVWLIDHFVFRKPRTQAAAAAKPQPVALREPGTVDYARSFFPVALIVLLVRAFIFEPFRIPSDSMMPTLLDGDFIVVNKYSYGLRWPVLNSKLVEFGTPQRGDVVVFRYPPHPETNFIKRLVGLPGDRIEVHDDHLVINGETIPLQDAGRYTDGCYVGLRLSTETVGEHTHKVMSCRATGGLQSMRDGELPAQLKLPDCDRKAFREKDGRRMCSETPPGAGVDSGDYPNEYAPPHWVVVPPGHYVAIGDNRDNSSDSRVWGLVPDANLVGKATRIWFNFDLQRPKWIDWGRIGQGIE